MKNFEEKTLNAQEGRCIQKSRPVSVSSKKAGHKLCRLDACMIFLMRSAFSAFITLMSGDGEKTLFERHFIQ